MRKCRLVFLCYGLLLEVLHFLAELHQFGHDFFGFIAHRQKQVFVFPILHQALKQRVNGNLFRPEIFAKENHWA